MSPPPVKTVSECNEEEGGKEGGLSASAPPLGQAILVWAWLLKNNL